MLDSERNQSQTFTRRTILVAGVQGLAFIGLGARLTQLQIVEGGRYKTLSENNRIDVQFLPPLRGRVLDDQGAVFAENIQDFRVFVLPEQIKSIDEAVDHLRDVITISEDEKKEAIKRMKKQNRFMPIMIRDHLSWDEVSAIELRLPELDGVQVRIGLTRSYPLGGNSAHIVGYVGAPTEKDVENNPLYKIPDVKIGKTGIERLYNDPLLGTPGSSRREVDVRGRIVRELETDKGVKGDDITLTLNANMQEFISQRLAQNARSGSAILMDAHNGDVYGMISYPSFDPNKFSVGISHQDWQIYRDDIAKPMNNKALSGAYPPGSTFKMITALAALEAGVIDEGTTYYCPGHFDLGKARFHCWKPQGHGTVDVVKAIAESCDVFFYSLARELGIERIAAMARRLGLGTETGLGFSEEAKGLVPDKMWKRRRYNESWMHGETVNATIGQGYTLATPIQLAVMTARLVNGGSIVKPRLIKALGDHMQPSPVFPTRSFDPKHLDLILQGMSNCVNDTTGTAYGSRIWEPGMEMGGKSGTAQVKRITKAERAAGVRNETLAWHLRHHALFVAYAPIINPRYVASVVIEHGGGGSSAAAPVARDILFEAQKRNLGDGGNAS